MNSNNKLNNAARSGCLRFKIKSLFIVLILLLVLPALVGCGNDNSISMATGSSPVATTVVPVPTTAASPSGGVSSTTVPTPTITTAASGVSSTVVTTPAVSTTTSPAVASTGPQLANGVATPTPGGTTPVLATGNLEVGMINVVNQVKAAVVLISVTSPQASGVGTGSIVTPDGYIVTNYHVIALGGNTVPAGSQVTVVLTNGKKYPAKIVRAVANNDLAVLKIEDTNLPTIKFGRSEALQIGEWVVAIGNALGLPGGPTVTAGIVGATGRSIQEPNGAQLVDLIQTNAQINPGNSGGPLLNLKGEMVGINTAAPVDPESQTAAQGIGFALSIDQTRPIIEALISGKGYSPPYMGILPVEMTPGLAARYNLPRDNGVLITQVVPGSPAAIAGWMANAILVEMDGTQVNDLSDLQKVLNKHKPGDTVQAKLVTPVGQEKTTSIIFGTAPNS
jgi:serine protease Do